MASTTIRGSSPTPIFHITRIENLRGVVRRGILAKNREPETVRNLAYESCQARRARRAVSCGPGGTLHDYAPFYFQNKSPMLYVRRGEQHEIVTLRTTVEHVIANGGRWVFSNGNASAGHVQIFDELTSLTEIDWPLMSAKWWSRIDEDPDRPTRRGAEFLVWERVPWEWVLEVGVNTTHLVVRAREAMQGSRHVPPINLRHDWYHN